jgi:hypothetical protein
MQDLPKSLLNMRQVEHHGPPYIFSSSVEDRYYRNDFSVSFSFVVRTRVGFSQFSGESQTRYIPVFATSYGHMVV